MTLWPEDPEDLYDDEQFEEWCEQVFLGQQEMLEVGKNNNKDEDRDG